MPKTKLVGIANLTPDSFSDDGQYNSTQAALAHIMQLVEDEADSVDIGAESTRPGAVPLTHEEEWQRLEPVLNQLPTPVVFSVDTRHPQTAAKALALGAGWINDVSGFANPAMVEAVKHSDCKLVVMHSLSIPADKNIVLSDSVDIIQELLSFIHTRVGYLENRGIAKERILFDPGIGFGKTPVQSAYILEHIAAFKPLGVPLYIGHSRKSFLGLPKDATNAMRDEATLAVSKKLIEYGVDYLRVHNVKAHRALLDSYAG
jgi:dihydropteroate synthase